MVSYIKNEPLGGSVLRKFKEYEEFKNPKNEDGFKGFGFDNLKDFLDYYYIIPKCQNYTDNELKFIDSKRVYFKCDKETKGCTFFKKKTKKKRFNQKEVEEIKKQHFEDGLSYKDLSFKYKCSKSTLYEIFKDKY